MRNRKVPGRSAGLLSGQVSEAVYFFFNLDAPARSLCTIRAGGRERCNPDYVIRRQKYGYTVLEFVAAGRGSVRLDRRKFPLRAGTVFVYRPDTRCEILTDPADRLVKYFILLSGRAAGARLAQAGVAPGRALQLFAHAEVQSLFEQLIHEGQARGRLSAAICKAQFDLLLLKIRQALARRQPVHQPGREKFLKLKRAIDTQAGRWGSLREIAGHAGISPAAACKLFRQHLGLSPIRYLMRRKMEVAAEFLLRTDGLIKEAAAQAGFADPYHFSRRFKSVHGISPRLMRAHHRTAAPRGDPPRVR